MITGSTYNLIFIYKRATTFQIVFVLYNATHSITLIVSKSTRIYFINYVYNFTEVYIASHLLLASRYNILKNMESEGVFKDAPIFARKLPNCGIFMVRMMDIRILYLKKTRKRTDKFGW